MKEVTPWCPLEFTLAINQPDSALAGLCPRCTCAAGDIVGGRGVSRPSWCWSFAGIVPSSRGAHCRPLHPRLASFFSLYENFKLVEKSSRKTTWKNSTGTPSQDTTPHLSGWKRGSARRRELQDDNWGKQKWDAKQTMPSTGYEAVKSREGSTLTTAATITRRGCAATACLALASAVAMYLFSGRTKSDQYIRHRLIGHRGAAFRCIFPGQQHISGGEDHTIRLWDVRSGKLIKPCRAHESRLCGMFFTERRDSSNT